MEGRARELATMETETHKLPNLALCIPIYMEKASATSLYSPDPSSLSSATKHELLSSS